MSMLRGSHVERDQGEQVLSLRLLVVGPAILGLSVGRGVVREPGIPGEHEQELPGLLNLGLGDHLGGSCVVGQEEAVEELPELPDNNPRKYFQGAVRAPPVRELYEVSVGVELGDHLQERQALLAVEPVVYLEEDHVVLAVLVRVQVIKVRVAVVVGQSVHVVEGVPRVAEILNVDSLELGHVGHVGRVSHVDHVGLGRPALLDAGGVGRPGSLGSLPAAGPEDSVVGLVAELLELEAAEVLWACQICLRGRVVRVGTGGVVELGVRAGRPSDGAHKGGKEEPGEVDQALEGDLGELGLELADLHEARVQELVGEREKPQAVPFGLGRVEDLLESVLGLLEAGRLDGALERGQNASNLGDGVREHGREASPAELQSVEELLELPEVVAGLKVKALSQMPRQHVEERVLEHEHQDGQSLGTGKLPRGGLWYLQPHRDHNVRVKRRGKVADAPRDGRHLGRTECYHQVPGTDRSGQMQRREVRRVVRGLGQTDLGQVVGLLELPDRRVEGHGELLSGNVLGVDDEAPREARVDVGHPNLQDLVGEGGVGALEHLQDLVGNVLHQVLPAEMGLRQKLGEDPGLGLAEGRVHVPEERGEGLPCDLPLAVRVELAREQQIGRTLLKVLLLENQNHVVVPQVLNDLPHVLEVQSAHGRPRMQNIRGGAVGPQKRVDDLPGQLRVQTIHGRLQNRLSLLPDLVDDRLRDRHLVNQTEEGQSRLQNLDHVLVALRPQSVPDHEVRKAVVVHLRHGLQAQDRSHSAQVAVQTAARIVGKEEGDVLGWLVLPKRTLIILSLRSMYG
ncbi:hypothetical protein OIY81_3699 [Cryptosporidium canis]|nr:hypothetical protein OIY81_3699 [Cryptosporidium canis]